jgi:hypothetical protein
MGSASSEGGLTPPHVLKEHMFKYRSKNVKKIYRPGFTELALTFTVENCTARSFMLVYMNASLKHMHMNTSQRSQSCE